MKRLFLFSLLVTATYAVCEEKKEEKITVKQLLQNCPALRLNQLDVPSFMPASSSPLKGIKSFSLTTNFPAESKRKIGALVDRELAAIGILVNEQKMADQGLMMIGSTNHLFLHLGEVLDTEGHRLPLTRINLALEMGVEIYETKMEVRPRVWSINAFVATPYDGKINEKIIDAVQKVVKDFVDSYNYANQEQSKKPSFYCMY